MLLLAFAAAPARASTWTLDRVLSTVMEKDPGIAAAKSAGEAGRAAAGTARSSLFPRLRLDGGWTRSDDPALLFSQKLQQGRFTADDFRLSTLNDPAPRNAWNGGVVVEQGIWNSGAEVTAPSLAGHLNAAADASERGAVADRLLGAVEIYVNAARARDALHADSIAMVAALEHRRAAVERFRMGQVPELDTLRAGTRAAEARVHWLSARNRLSVSLTRLTQLVGTAVAAGDLGDLPPVDPDRPPGTPSDPAASAALRGELLAAQEIARARDVEAKRASYARLPSVNARFDYRLHQDAESDDGQDRFLVGVTASLPIWDGQRVDDERRAARARADHARAQAELLRRDLEAEAEEAAADVSVSRERVLAARLAAESSAEALRLAQARYQSGLLSQSDLLAVDTEAARTRLGLIQAQADEVLAHYRDRHARGQLP